MSRLFSSMHRLQKLSANLSKSLALLGCSFLLSANVTADYSRHPEAVSFIKDMVTKHNFTEAEVKRILKGAEKRQGILDAMSRPAEKTRTWKEYRPIFIQPLRVNGGVAFWKENQEALDRAERMFGVPAEIIVAIIGVETNYGRNTGSYHVLDALSTLAFDYPPRAPFFRSELENYLILTREHDQDPFKFKGSYAGAMGYGQFMPSSYRNYAIDFTGDGFADIWNDKTDAIGSVANYFVKHGWQAGEAVILPATLTAARDTIKFNDLQVPNKTLADWRKLGLTAQVEHPQTAKAVAIEFDGENGLEYWLGLQNFYTITRYNRSPMYAMAVYQLAQDIKAAKK
ncbi:MAG: lytic murein transglycosylase B [Cellvibrio sp.]